MADFHIKVLDAPGGGGWTAELWTGFPGAPDQEKVAGAGEYSAQELERADAQGNSLALNLVLQKIRKEENQDLIFGNVGLRLFELLEKTGVAPDWLKRAGKADRTYFQLPASLEEWPWELLARLGYKSTPVPLFLSRRTGCMRVFVRTQQQLEPIKPPLRVLLVSGEEILDPTNNFLASEELRDIRKIFFRAGVSAFVELCESPEQKHLLPAAISSFNPHILHFIGHGDIPLDGDYYLRFKRDQTWQWSKTEIRNFFGNLESKPRLVVLNACHGSRFEAHAASVAEALLDAEVPAVIGAQAALRVDYARQFARAFYESLLKEKAIDKAVAEARNLITQVAQYGGQNRRHWALPVLTVTAPVQQILGFKEADPQVKSCRIVKDVYGRPGRFVDRVSDRWSIISSFEEPAVRGVILSGDPELGKSWLVLRSIRDFLDAGFLVRYANLTSAVPGRTSIDVLLDWRGNPNEDSPLLGPIPGPYFTAFDQAYAQAKREPGVAAVQDVFATFKKGLQSVLQRRAGSKALLIVDRFRQKSGMATVAPPDFREGIQKHLLLPLQEISQEVSTDSDLDGVYVLMVVRKYTGLGAGELSDEEEYGLAQLSTSVFKRRAVIGFRKDQIDNLFDEFSEFSPDPLAGAVRNVLRLSVKTETWSPAYLEQLDRLLPKG